MVDGSGGSGVMPYDVYGSKPSDYTMYETQLNQLLDVLRRRRRRWEEKGLKRKWSRKEEL